MKRCLSIPFKISEIYENDGDHSFNIYSDFENINPKIVYVNERGVFKSIVITKMVVPGRELHHINELRHNEYMSEEPLPYQVYDMDTNVPEGYGIKGYFIYGVVFPEPAFVVDVVGVSRDFFSGSSRVLSEFEQFYYKHINDYNNIPKEYFRKQGSKLYLLKVSSYGKLRG